MTDKRTLIAAAITVVLLAVAYNVAQRMSKATDGAPAAPATAASAPAPVASGPKRFSVDVAKLPPGNTPTFTVQQGDAASFTVVAPRTGKLALHGYTEDMPLVENQPLTFTLKAELSGRFPMHIHGADGSHTEVANVEVLPR